MKVLSIESGSPYPDFSNESTFLWVQAILKAQEACKVKLSCFKGIVDPTCRACLAVRFTAKNGDPPGAGKIWENRFYTGKMGPHWPENAQMDISTCQRPRGACQNFFSFTIQAVAVTFLKVYSQFAPRGPKFTWISSIQLISYFSLIFSTFLHHLLYSAQLWQALQEWSFCTGNTTKLWLINFFVAI